MIDWRAECEEFWRYAFVPSRSEVTVPAQIGLLNRRGERIEINTYRTKKPRPARNGRGARPAGLTVCVAIHRDDWRRAPRTAWASIGTIVLPARELVVDPVTAGSSPRGVQAVEWVLAQLRAGIWPLPMIEVWHLGRCGCGAELKRKPGRAPPYPECAACAEDRELRRSGDNVVRFRPERDFEVDDEIH